MVVTCNLEKDERMGWSTYKVRVNGKDLCGITDQTPKKAVDKFFELCKLHAKELDGLIRDADKAREWNMRQPSGKGKNWPAFGKLERMRNRLSKEAGIKDT